MEGKGVPVKGEIRDPLEPGKKKLSCKESLEGYPWTGERVPSRHLELYLALFARGKRERIGD